MTHAPYSLYSMHLAPRAPSERNETIDILRGLALLGVLLVNLLTIFRVSLFRYLEAFHTEPGALNHAVDWALALLVESKSFALFSLLFGVGLSIFHERASEHTVHPRLLLARRLVVLLAIGLVHLVLVWNGDILTAYAIAGLLVVPLVGRRPWLSMALVLTVGLLSCLPLPLPDVLPHGAAAARHGAEAARIYGGGSWWAILQFRWMETRQYILPLLALTLPRVIALFLLGDLVWSRGIFRDPDRHRTTLRASFVVGLAIGGTATGVTAWAASTGHSLGSFERLAASLSNVPLALGYGAGLVLWRTGSWRSKSYLTVLAPVGRMALTNYLVQSVVFGLVFYGYGLGLFDRLEVAPTCLFGLAFYGVQILLSHLWLARFRFGPCEWAWRSLTYGRRQPM